ncbi:MAG: hypothetical protein A3D67_01725 [Candidatus Lloydbacteria bacterium RIFCSPHIGHO2_02_FULL_51_22]|uniref:Uncharacterized protein n=2 Tax=Candidatus Lloydiibacteriota TaxID=1817910 RepID=A0A1G2DFX0_9BACT|nr:MAG: hypothetical protein A3D67_01725 [Candidatus Lloydbacteria bacterium RIFCSPHIGHO2_02_FULL_51_22]OGZ14757.1 MAG: hypothetical protein A3J08_04230 [Candidatus Lloydbacteria bacterium RIFCSPLOWO2_02_FULL_51_11]
MKLHRGKAFVRKYPTNLKTGRPATKVLLLVDGDVSMLAEETLYALQIVEKEGELICVVGENTGPIPEYERLTAEEIMARM